MANIVETTAFLPMFASDAAVLSGGSYQPTLPLANCQSKEVSYVTRTTNTLLTSTRFDVDMGSSKSVDVVALAGLKDFTGDALIQISAATLQADLDAPPYQVPWRSLWPSTGKPTTPDWQSFIAWINVPVTNYRWWRVEFNDTANPKGYLQWSRIAIEKALWPHYNVFYGFDSGADSFDAASMSPWGGTMTDPHGQVRTWSMPFDYMKKDDYDVLDVWTHRWGTAMDFFTAFGPTTEADAHRFIFVSRLANKPRFGRVNRIPNCFKTKLDVVEIVQ